MKARQKHKLAQSVLLWADHVILKDNEGFSNQEGLFYNVADSFNGLYTYASKFQQVVADSSVSGAVILSGLDVDGTFYQTGEGDFYEFNYDKGQAYFSSDEDASVISGDYAVKDFSIFLSDFEEETVLFETKNFVNNKYINKEEGIPEGSVTFPSIMIKNTLHDNAGFAFGGLDEEKDNFRFLVLSDSKFKLDSILGLFEEKIRCYIPLLEQNENPFNGLGGLRNGSYNYQELTANKIAGTSDTVFIKDVSTSKFGENSFTRKLENSLYKNKVYIGIIDLEINTIRIV